MRASSVQTLSCKEVQSGERQNLKHIPEKQNTLVINYSKGNERIQRLHALDACFYCLLKVTYFTKQKAWQRVKADGVSVFLASAFSLSDSLASTSNLIPSFVCRALTLSQCSVIP